ncbi:MAG: biotin/lipoyl-binding protein [Elusimicrobiota bacterium]|nr:biotin/lipoyl-binding protein [Elusimicrobiota bacterium]
MKIKLLNSAALLLAASAAFAAGPAAPPAPQSPVWNGVQQHTLKTGDIVIYTPVTGIATAQQTYDIFAPFDGRVEELQTEVFSFVTPLTVLTRMVSTEMAALLDSSPEESRKQTERRWQDIYSYTEIKPEIQGVVTNIYVEPGTRVNKGDRLFTVAKKVVIIGKNTEPLYSKLAAGMTAKVQHARNTEMKFETELVDFLRIKGTPLISRLWLEVLDLREGIKIGEQFNGVLFVGKSTNAMLVPRQHVIESGGRRFLITEIQTGLETAEEIELLGHSSLYLEPVRRAAEIKDGKDKKAL